MGWVEVCKQLEKAVVSILDDAPWQLLSNQLQGVPPARGELQLVSAKVVSMCGRLQQCKVSRDRFLSSRTILKTSFKRNNGNLKSKSDEHLPDQMCMLPSSEPVKAIALIEHSIR